MNIPFPTRKPTGEVPAPNILAAGEEGAGKTYWAFSAAADNRFGDVFVIDVGEGCADQYAPLGDYNVVEHDGTLPGLARIAAAVRDQLASHTEDGRPNVVIVDSVSRIWELAKDEAEATARQRQSRRGNSNSEPNITMDLWNRARARYEDVVIPLLDWNGVVVLTARGRWAALVEGGRPVPGQQTWTVETHKQTPFDVDVVLRFEQPRKVSIQKARTLTMNLPTDKLLDISGVTVGELVFDKLGVTDPVRRKVQRPAGSVDVPSAKTQLVDACGGDKTRAGALWREAGLPNGKEEYVTDAQLAAVLAAAGAPAAVTEEVPREEPDEAAGPASEKSRRRLHAVRAEHGLSHDAVKRIIKSTLGYDSTKQLTEDDIDDLIEAIEAGEYDDEVPM